MIKVLKKEKQRKDLMFSANICRPHTHAHISLYEHGEKSGDLLIIVNTTVLWN